MSTRPRRTWPRATDRVIPGCCPCCTGGERSGACDVGSSRDGNRAMKALDLMSRFGLFLQPAFIPEDLCVALRHDLFTSVGEAARVFVGEHGHLRPDIRRTLEVPVAETLRAEVQARLHGIRPA